MINAEANGKTKAIKMSLEGDVGTIAQEMMMLIASAYDALVREDTEAGEELITVLAAFTNDLALGEIDPIKNSKCISINPAFEKFLEDYKD